MSAQATSTAVRVLVVDDDYDLLDSMTTVLRMYGFDVTEAAGGTEALALLTKRAYDVALVDVGMSGMNGYQLAVEVTGSLGDERPVLIALTGWSREEDRLRAAASGFDHFFVKPVQIETLRALLENIRRRAMTSNATSDGQVRKSQSV